MLSTGLDESAGFISAGHLLSLETDPCSLCLVSCSRFVQAEWRWRRREPGQSTFRRAAWGYFRISHSCSRLYPNLFSLLRCTFSWQNTVILKSCSLHLPAGLQAASPSSAPFCSSRGLRSRHISPGFENPASALRENKSAVTWMFAPFLF